MKTRTSSGRCSIPNSAALVALLWWASASATPTVVDAELTLDVVEGGWSEIILEDNPTLPLDEEIFTELSPIVSTDEGVRLPDDQAEE